MAQWIAKLAAAERDYQETLAAMRRAPGEGASSALPNPRSKPPAAPTGRGWRGAAAGQRAAAAAAPGAAPGTGQDGAAAPPAGALSAAAALAPDDTDAWFLDALDMLMAHSPDSGDRAAEAVRENLRSRDQCAPHALPYETLPKQRGTDVGEPAEYAHIASTCCVRTLMLQAQPAACSLRTAAVQRGRAASVTAVLVGDGWGPAPAPRTHAPPARARQVQPRCQPEREQPGAPLRLRSRPQAAAV